MPKGQETQRTRGNGQHILPKAGNPCMSQEQGLKAAENCPTLHDHVLHMHTPHTHTYIGHSLTHVHHTRTHTHPQQPLLQSGRAGTYARASSNPPNDPPPPILGLVQETGVGRANHKLSQKQTQILNKTKQTVVEVF